MGLRSVLGEMKIEQVAGHITAIVGARQTGKTTKAIELLDEDSIVVTSSQANKDLIHQQFDIPKHSIETIHDFLKEKIPVRGKKILFDNAETIADILLPSNDEYKEVVGTGDKGLVRLFEFIENQYDIADVILTATTLKPRITIPIRTYRQTKLVVRIWRIFIEKVNEVLDYE